jgi:hypothetical protein
VTQLQAFAEGRCAWQLSSWLTLGTVCWLQGVGLQAVIQRDVKVLSEADTQAVMAYLRVFR